MSLVQHMHQALRYPLIYLADLDAIQGTGSNVALLDRISATFPKLKLWFDGGFRRSADLAKLRGQARIRTVIGSETWEDANARIDPEAIFSIDSDADGLRDRSGICADPSRLPATLILMNLTRVGSRNGPDIELVRQWRTRAPDAGLYLAGGIRSPDDLPPLADAGVAGVLLASALHDGRFDSHIVTHLS